MKKKKPKKKLYIHFNKGCEGYRVGHKKNRFYKPFLVLGITYTDFSGLIRFGTWTAKEGSLKDKIINYFGKGITSHFDEID